MVKIPLLHSPQNEINSSQSTTRYFGWEVINILETASQQWNMTLILGKWLLHHLTEQCGVMTGGVCLIWWTSDSFWGEVLHNFWEERRLLGVLWARCTFDISDWFVFWTSLRSTLDSISSILASNGRQPSHTLLVLSGGAVQELFWSHTEWYVTGSENWEVFAQPLKTWQLSKYQTPRRTRLSAWSLCRLIRASLLILWDSAGGQNAGWQPFEIKSRLDLRHCDSASRAPVPMVTFNMMISERYGQYSSKHNTVHQWYGVIDYSPECLSDSTWTASPNTQIM